MLDASSGEGAVVHDRRAPGLEGDGPQSAAVAERARLYPRNAVRNEELRDAAPAEALAPDSLQPAVQLHPHQFRALPEGLLRELRALLGDVEFLQRSAGEGALPDRPHPALPAEYDIRQLAAVRERVLLDDGHGRRNLHAAHARVRKPRALDRPDPAGQDDVQHLPIVPEIPTGHEDVRARESHDFRRLRNVYLHVLWGVHNFDVLAVREDGLTDRLQHTAVLDAD